MEEIQKEAEDITDEEEIEEEDDITVEEDEQEDDITVEEEDDITVEEEEQEDDIIVEEEEDIYVEEEEQEDNIIFEEEDDITVEEEEQEDDIIVEEEEDNIVDDDGDYLNPLEQQVDTLREAIPSPPVSCSLSQPSIVASDSLHKQWLLQMVQTSDANYQMMTHQMMMHQMMMQFHAMQALHHNAIAGGWYYPTLPMFGAFGGNMQMFGALHAGVGVNVHTPMFGNSVNQIRQASGSSTNAMLPSARSAFHRPVMPPLSRDGLGRTEHFIQHLMPNRSEDSANLLMQTSGDGIGGSGHPTMHTPGGGFLKSAVSPVTETFEDVSGGSCNIQTQATESRGGVNPTMQGLYGNFDWTVVPAVNCPQPAGLNANGIDGFTTKTNSTDGFNGNGCTSLDVTRSAPKKRKARNDSIDKIGSEKIVEKKWKTDEFDEDSE
jgi:hypothetical protein